MHVHPRAVSNRVSAETSEVILHEGGPYPNDWSPSEGGKSGHREIHVMPGAETGVMHLQTKEGQECSATPEVGRRQGRVFPQSLRKERGPADSWTLDTQPPELQTRTSVLL